MNSSMTLFHNNVREQATNPTYPFRVEIHNADDLKTVVAYDHVSAEYTDNRRKNNNFITSNCTILSGKLYCGYCKEKMIGHSSNQISKKGVIFNYYKCKNSGGNKACKKKMVKKDYIEDIIVKECRNLLTSKNIKRIAKEMMWIVSNMESKAELQRLEKELEIANMEKENQMKSLRMCSDDSIRTMIFEDLSKIGAQIKELERQLEIEKSRHFVVTEEQIIVFLESLAKGDVNDITYRRSLIKMFVNKIFLYDDKFTITFNTGDDETEITEKLFDEIENGLSGEKLCLSSNVAHQ